MIWRKIGIIIILLIIGCFLVNIWVVILTTDVAATWRHFTGPVLFLILVYLFFRDLRMAIVGTGVFLLAGLGNVFTLTPDIIWDSYGMRLGSIQLWTPSVQVLSLELFLLYCALNFRALMEYWVDYEDWKYERGKARKIR